ncbi:TonB-dependent receptor [Burkholderiaceae bacterium DAT-1]|nr:TonB-dependent receptor [Burkholderiaceae bacterium DAT-1]
MKLKQLTLALGLIGFASAMGSHALAADGEEGTKRVEKIEVTGSSIKRVAKEGALPLTTLNREDIAKTGATTAQDLVALIPSNFGGTVVASNVGATGIASTAALRALPSKYTLVMINGRRVASYAFGNPVVDLNSIPLAAVDRVEILRDGASALYGADAIAGVINFILKKDFRGVESSAYWTKNTHDGGNSEVYSVTAGFGNLDENRFNLLFTASHEFDQALRAVDRDYAKTGVRPDLGLIKSSPRNGIPNVTFSDVNNPYVEGNDWTQHSVNPTRASGCNTPGFAMFNDGPTACRTDYVSFIDLIPKQSHDNISGRFTYAIDNDTQFFAEASHVKDIVLSHYSPAPYTKQMDYPVGGPFYPKTITLPVGYTLKKGYKMPDGTVLAADTVLTSPMSVVPVGPISGRWRTVAGGGRGDETVQSSNRIVIGMKGNAFGWDYDGAINWSTNDGEVRFAGGQYSYAKLTPLVEKGLINVFGAQTAESKRLLDSAEITGPENNAISKSTEFELHGSRAVAELTDGSVMMSIGGSFRKESLEQISQPVLASGDQVGGNGPVPSVSGDRKIYALFSEVIVPVQKDLELNFSGRYDNYKNGFGTSFSRFSPKAAFQYSPTESVKVRGSMAQGFRAPSLYENLLPFTAGNNTNASWNDPIRCPNGVPVTSKNKVGDLQDECNVQAPTANGGNPNLKPEKSNQYSLGLVFEPAKDMSLSIDYWHIKVDDAIATLAEAEAYGMSTWKLFQQQYFRYDPNYTAPDGSKPYAKGWDASMVGKGPLLQGSVNPDFPLAYVYTPWQNLANYFADGIDINYRYRLKVTDVGTFNLNVDGTRMTKHGYTFNGSNGAVTVNDAGVFQSYGATPKWRHAITLSFARGPVRASLTNNYTSSYTDYNFGQFADKDNGADRTVDAFSTWDMQASYDVMKNATVGFGVKNMFDKEPPASRNSNNFQAGYDAQNANPLGRQLYFRLRYKFF